MYRMIKETEQYVCQHVLSSFARQDGYRWTKDAKEALHEATELFLTHEFCSAAHVMNVSKKKTLLKEHYRLVAALRFKDNGYFYLRSEDTKEILGRPHFTNLQKQV